MKISSYWLVYFKLNLMSMKKNFITLEAFLLNYFSNNRFQSLKIVQKILEKKILNLPTKFLISLIISFEGAAERCYSLKIILSLLSLDEERLDKWVLQTQLYVFGYGLSRRNIQTIVKQAFEIVQANN